MKNPNLYKLYRKFNRLYFDSLLSNDISLYYEDLEPQGLNGYCEPWNYEIGIHNNLSGFSVRSTLVHEMIHAFEYLIEDKEYADESEYHTIDFYWHAIRIHQLSGYEVA